MATADEQRELLAIAREAIAGSLKRKPLRDLAQAHGRLAEPGGAFVTIRIGDQLRGCIGYIESPLPLARVVAEVAVKAAREDPRFPPLTIEELDLANLEVSVLSPMRPVQDVAEIRVGEHGLLLELGWRRGLLLPQVALEFGWNAREFLENTARKAGLHPNAWQDPNAKLYMFSAEVCHEELAH
ncbi:MAG TPA: AmmeMemoRadiSam system protein A [Bacteroidota bacterium]|nr:AmmeMemoRadiSam system protein A [Bacteroidota bacterium]